MQGTGGQPIAGCSRGAAMAASGGRQQLGGKRRPRRRPEQPGGRDACWRPPGARRDAASTRPAGEARRELGTRAGGGRPGARREPGEGTASAAG